MRDYYHFYLTCPNCHEPYITGAPLEIEDAEIKCSSCQSVFRQYIDIRPYTCICNELLQKNQNQEIFSQIPLLWKASPNIIEETYVDWIKKEPEGKYIVTWPWKRVKFLPLLFSEYILNFPESSVAVIGEIKRSENDYITYPGINEIFQHLIYLDPKVQITSELRKEMNKFSRKDVIFKKERTFYVIRKLGTDDTYKYRMEAIYDGSIEKCRREIFSELQEEFGDKCIRIYRKVPSKRRPKLMNENGLFDVTIGVREEWTGDLKYNKVWLWESLLNAESMARIQSIAENKIFLTEEDFNKSHEPYGVYLISDSIDSNLIFNKLLQIKPKIVIIENLDDFIRDKIYAGRISKAFFEFLKKTTSTVLMFSINPDIRHLMDINHPNSFLSKYNIELHTWDSSRVIDRLRHDFTDYHIHSPLFSLLDELPNYGHKPVVEYIPVQGLNEIDDLIGGLNFDKSDILYLNEVKKTPLNIKGDYTKPDVFKRLIGGSIVHYDNLIGKLMRKEKETAIEVMKILKDVYNLNIEPENPLFDKIMIFLRDLLTEEHNMVSLVVHGMDIKGMELILNQKGFGSYLDNQVSPVSWKGLSIRERDIPDGYNHIVISTRQPSFDYQIYNAVNTDKFIFVGSERDLKKTGLIIDNRITEDKSRPLITPSDDAPELLKSIIKDINPVEYDYELMINEKSEFDFINHISPEGNFNQKSRHLKIRRGSPAILVIDDQRSCMFLPLNKHIFFKMSEQSNVSEIKLKKSSIDEIVNKEIILDRHGVYTSFKHVFTKFMIENGDKTKLRAGVYRWDNFGDLLADSVRWIEALRQTIKKIMKQRKMSESEADNFLSEYLSSLNLNAKNKDYIKNWWSEPEFVSTDVGPIPVYDIEHPKSREDLIKMYKGINEIFTDVQLDVEDADKSYIAARTVQKLRRRFFKDDKRKIPLNQDIIFKLLGKEIKKIINESNSFKVKSASIITLKEDVYPLEKIPEEDALNFIES